MTALNFKSYWNGSVDVIYASSNAAEELIYLNHSKTTLHSFV